MPASVLGAIAVLEVDEFVRTGCERGGLRARRLDVVGMHQLDIGALDELVFRVAKTGFPRRIDRSKEAFPGSRSKGGRWTSRTTSSPRLEPSLGARRALRRVPRPRRARPSGSRSRGK